MKILLVGQARLSPALLQQFPIDFESLVDDVMADTRTYPTPRVLYVDDTFKVPATMTAYRANPDGLAELWRARFLS